MDLSQILRRSAGLQVQRLADGRHRIAVAQDAGCPGAATTWTTCYPPELILEIHAATGGYVCDEIMREEDPRCVEQALRHELLGYVDAEEFGGTRVLDFGCAGGASTLVMRRLLPPCEIVGIDGDERLLRVAEVRADRLGSTGIHFVACPSRTALPEDIGTFDYIVLNTLHEPMPPFERRLFLPRLWDLLRPEGVLFIDPAPVCGAPAREIMAILAGCGIPALLRQRGGSGKTLSFLQRFAWLKRAIGTVRKALKEPAGQHLVREGTMAIRKIL